MGTRNLTAVYMDGEYRVAKYCQWDGYPEGQGLKCLHFLRDEMDEKKLREELLKAGFIDGEKYNAILQKYGASEDGFISCDNSYRMLEVFPELHRDTGADILEMIQNGMAPFGTLNSLRFAADSLFCEWAWVIDFDKRTFEVYEGYNEISLTEEDRFFFLREFEDPNCKYHAVKKAAEWCIDALPTDEDFVAAFKKDEEEDDE